MLFRNVIKLFDNHSVCVCGMKGTGKDLLMGNVIARKNKDYISNLDYTNDSHFYLCDFDKLMLSHNSYNDIICGCVKPYTFPYPLGSDIYISDAGIYFPSQYCNELNKRYFSFPFFMALSRQVADGTKVHINTQNLNRCWDKIREMSDIYITCNRCWYFFGFVLQKITIYDKYDSCLNRVRPCRVSQPLTFNPMARATVDTYRDNFFNVHGDVKSKWLLYRNKSKHDTLYFKKFFAEGGVKYEK